MKEETLGEYMVAKPLETKTKTKKWSIENKDHGTELGIVKWHPSWRQYCFYTHPVDGDVDGIVLSAGCMSDLQGFLDKINKEHRMEGKRKSS